tara:strand:+ start:246 stop:404 length:159 start_codon:yes stop_codon:yes gene_type:complete
MWWWLYLRRNGFTGWKTNQARRVSSWLEGRKGLGSYVWGRTGTFAVDKSVDI